MFFSGKLFFISLYVWIKRDFVGTTIDTLDKFLLLIISIINELFPNEVGAI